MKQTLFLTLLFPLALTAQTLSRDALEQKLLKTLREVRENITVNIQMMDEKDLYNTERLLNRASLITLGRRNEALLISTGCASELPEVFQTTLASMKSFAYSSSGFNMSSEDASRYAMIWTQNFPCQMAEKFIASFKRLKTFAYSSNGLNMSAENAKNYAQKMIETYCPQIDFEASYVRHYNFGYSSGGLNLNAEGARKYAQGKMESEAFICAYY